MIRIDFSVILFCKIIDIFCDFIGGDDFAFGVLVAEPARLTESRPELDEQEQRELNARLCALADHIQEHPEVRIRYFVPDERKSGGAIVEICGTVKKLVAADGTIVMADGTVIPICDLLNIARSFVGIVQ